MNNNCNGCNKPNKIISKGLCDSCYRKSRLGIIPLKKCECSSPECQEMIPSINYKTKKENKFAIGHHIKGKKNPRYNGRYIDKQGHIMVKYPVHPYLDSRGYIRLNRLVYEKYISEKTGEKFYLHPSKGIKHKNGDKNNFDISNLEVVDRGNKWRITGSVLTPRIDYSIPWKCIGYGERIGNCNSIRKYSGQYCETCYRRMKQSETPFKKCECNEECTALIPSITFRGGERRFAQGHNIFGELNPNWKGGIRITKEGYIYILNKEHPFCDYAGYVPEHHLVLEKKLGRYLTKDEVGHHINEIKDDNRPENIILMTKSEHTRYHKTKKKN